jgi:hypothetical protein
MSAAIEGFGRGLRYAFEDGWEIFDKIARLSQEEQVGQLRGASREKKPDLEEKLTCWNGKSSKAQASLDVSTTLPPELFR